MNETEQENIDLMKELTKVRKESTELRTENSELRKQYSEVASALAKLQAEYEALVVKSQSPIKPPA